MANCIASTRQLHIPHLRVQETSQSYRHANDLSARRQLEPRSSIPFSVKLGLSGGAKRSDRSDSSSELSISKQSEREEPAHSATTKWNRFRDLDDRQAEQGGHKPEHGRLWAKWFTTEPAMSRSSGGSSDVVNTPTMPRGQKLWIDTKVQDWGDKTLVEESEQSAMRIEKWSPPRPPRCTASVQSPAFPIGTKGKVSFRAHVDSPADEKPLPELPLRVRQKPIVNSPAVHKPKHGKMRGSESSLKNEALKLQVQPDANDLMTGASAPSPELLERIKTTSPDIQALVRDASKMQVWELDGFINGPCYQNSPQNSKKAGKVMLVPDFQIRRAKEQGRQIKVPGQDGVLQWAEIERLQVWELIGWVKYCKWTEYGKQVPGQSGPLARARKSTVFQCDLQGAPLFPTLREEGWEVICMEQTRKRTAGREVHRQDRKAAKGRVRHGPMMSVVDEQVEMEMMTPEKKVEMRSRLDAEIDRQKMIKLKKKLMTEYRRQRVKAAAEHAASLEEKRVKLHAKVDMEVENEKKIKKHAKEKALARVRTEERATAKAREQSRKQKEQNSVVKHPRGPGSGESPLNGKEQPSGGAIFNATEECELLRTKAELERLKKDVERLMRSEYGGRHVQAVKVHDWVGGECKV